MSWVFGFAWGAVFPFVKLDASILAASFILMGSRVVFSLLQSVGPCCFVYSYLRNILIWNFFRVV